MIDAANPIQITVPGPGSACARVEREIAECVNAGARWIHGGHDGYAPLDLSPEAIAEWLGVVRRAGNGIMTSVEIGGTEAIPAQLPMRWTVNPDFASIDFGSANAHDVADRMLSKGVGVEACLADEDATKRFLCFQRRPFCRRLVLRIPDLPAAVADERLTDLIYGVAGVISSHDVVLEGRGRSAWPIAERALRGGLALRIGSDHLRTSPSDLQHGTPAEVYRRAAELHRATGRRRSPSAIVAPI